MTTINRNTRVTSVVQKANSERLMGRILLEAGKLSASQVEQILIHQRKRGVRFGEAALELRMVSKSDIAMALACQFHYPRLPVTETQYPAALVAAYRPESAEAEALRAMRSQLNLRWFSETRKKLAIVSIDRGDGASLLIANLAVSFCQLGKRTLVVDANLRNPTQHRIFKLNNREGVSDIVVGRSGLEAVESLESFSGLSVLPAGTPPPNPMELVSGPAFEDLLDNLAIRFDVILCDSPAFMTAADAISISASAGGVMLVARKDKTILKDVRGANQQLAGTDIPVVGSVLLEF